METITSFALFSSVGLILILKVINVSALAIWLGSTVAALRNFNSSRVSKLIFGAATIHLVTAMIHIGARYELSFYSSWGISLVLGNCLGFLMWTNLLIGTKLGKVQNLNFANLVFAVPMLFFLEVAYHLGIPVNAESERWTTVVSLSAPILMIEIYFLVGKGPQATNFKRSLAAGVLLLLILYTIFEVTTK